MALAVSFTETRAAVSPAIVPMPQHIAYAAGEGAVLSAAAGGVGGSGMGL